MQNIFTNDTMVDRFDWETTERGLLPNLIRNKLVQITAPFLILASPEGVVDEFTFADL